MNLFFSLLMFVVLWTSTAGSEKWWQTMSLYQIYPRSFKDSDSDGIGDLRGVYEKLEHLKDSNIDAFWLSPIFPSPMIDMGYDISNFVDIEPTFGTLKDFDELLEKAHSLGLKVILDFVPNHSSDKHEWFQKSIKNISPYSDYYIWMNGTVKDDGTIVPPNNWVSVFRGSAWTWNDERQAFYLHQFAPEQPDFNYHNKYLVEEMKNVLRFWLDKGVDGFRCDAIPHLFEDPAFPDEPLTGFTDDPESYAYVDHIYTRDRHETYEMVEQWRRVADEYEGDRIIVIEAYAPVNLTMKFYDFGAHFPFNFGFIERLNEKSTANDFKAIIEEWLTSMPEGSTANWVAGNHDKKRLATRFGAAAANSIVTILLLLPGVSVTYNGDEIGMPDNFVSWEETVDPQGCNAGVDGYVAASRDPARTPFLWDNTTSAGFSSNPHTWLPVNPDYKELNLLLQKSDENSVFRFYQAISALRKLPVCREGALQTYVFNDNILAFSRTLEGHQPIFVVKNFAGEAMTVDLGAFGDLPRPLFLYRSTPGSGLNDGEEIDPQNAVIPANGAAVYTTTKTF